MSLRHAILGFLSLEPASGYTLMQRFEGSVGSFWSATQSQIYRELHVLEQAGLVQMELVPQDGKPARKVYRLTTTGDQELESWLHAPIEPMQLRDPFQLRLVFAGMLPAAELAAMFDDYERDLSARRAEYAGRLGAAEIFSLARSPQERLVWSLSIESGLAWCESQLLWVRGARSKLTSLPKAARRRRNTLGRTRQAR